MKCEICGRYVELPFECSFCQGHFCTEHRLPENHDCQEAPERSPLGSWEAKQRMIEQKEKATREKSMMVSEGEFHFIKKELPVFEMPKGDFKEGNTAMRKSRSRVGFLKRRKKGVKP
jgi:hypothetical protein